MLCKTVQENLEAFVDAELDLALADRIAAHLRICPACAAELELARQVSTALHELPHHDAPPAVLREVKEQSRRESDERRRRDRWRVADPSRASHRARARRAAWWSLAASLALASGLALARWRTSGLPPVEPQPRYDAAQVAHATVEARLALAEVARLSRRAGFALRDDVLKTHVVLPAARRSLSPLNPTPDPPPATGAGRRQRNLSRS